MRRSVGRRHAEKKAGKLNPAKIAPEAVESLMFIKRIALDENGQEISKYCLAVRTQMGEAFCKSRKSYADGPHLVGTLSSDWGVINFLSFNHEVSTPQDSKFAKAAKCAPKGPPLPCKVFSKRHGVGFLQNEVEPLCAKAVALEGSRQKAKAKLVADTLAQMLQAVTAKLYLQSGPSDIKELFMLHKSLCPKAHAHSDGFGIASCQSRKLRQQAKGKVENFLGTMLNHAVSEFRPRAIVAERLDLRDGGLSAELNSLISNEGRAFLEGKLNDIFEKFGADIYRVEAAYTLQECAKCGHIHPGNRKGEDFKCLACGHQAHADENAAETSRSDVRFREPAA